MVHALKNGGDYYHYWLFKWSFYSDPIFIAYWVPTLCCSKLSDLKRHAHAQTTSATSTNTNPVSSYLSPLKTLTDVTNKVEVHWGSWRVQWSQRWCSWLELHLCSQQRITKEVEAWVPAPPVSVRLRFGGIGAGLSPDSLVSFRFLFECRFHSIAFLDLYKITFQCISLTLPPPHSPFIFLYKSFHPSH